jgi:hypothetical protein
LTVKGDDHARPRSACSARATARQRQALRRGPYPAEKARGGEIILDTPARRAIFIAGLAGAIVLAILLTLIGLSR